MSYLCMLGDETLTNTRRGGPTNPVTTARPLLFGYCCTTIISLQPRSLRKREETVSKVEETKRKLQTVHDVITSVARCRRRGRGSITALKFCLEINFVVKLHTIICCVLFIICTCNLT